MVVWSSLTVCEFSYRNMTYLAFVTSAFVKNFACNLPYCLYTVHVNEVLFLSCPTVCQSVCVCLCQNWQTADQNLMQLGRNMCCGAPYKVPPHRRCWCRQLVGPPSVTVRFLWLPCGHGTVCRHRPGPPPQYWHSDERLSLIFSVSHLADRNLAPFPADW